MKRARRRIDVNLEELDRVLDGAREAPLNEADYVRTRPTHGVDGFFNSAMPWRITGLSTAAANRRERSSNNLLTAENRVLIPVRSITSSG
ncbi:MAG TPA: hypothetical protein VFQ79_14620 [Bryobacteraceae bacterium]|nr:hypothetical protein [Bryobacteraceae bacterium]